MWLQPLDPEGVFHFSSNILHCVHRIQWVMQVTQAQKCRRYDQMNDLLLPRVAEELVGHGNSFFFFCSDNLPIYWSSTYSLSSTVCETISKIFDDDSWSHFFYSVIILVCTLPAGLVWFNNLFLLACDNITTFSKVLLCQLLINEQNFHDLRAQCCTYALNCTLFLLYNTIEIL